ncbi:MAG: type IV pilus assembly protein PilV [Gammaproteobacteria bacterium]|jgi:type IV pilus assembly protein PilV
MLKIIHQQRGVSLVESMIALLVISVGLLGIAALQITSISQNSSALHHNQAVWAAYDMSDRIRANYTQFAGYAGQDTNAAAAQDCLTQTCTGVQMINADVDDWATLVANLPSGRGQIIANPADANELLVAVMWDDAVATNGGAVAAAGGGAAGGACPIATLSCYTAVVSR